MWSAANQGILGSFLMALIWMAILLVYGGVIFAVWFTLNTPVWKPWYVEKWYVILILTNFWFSLIKENNWLQRISHLNILHQPCVGSFIFVLFWRSTVLYCAISLLCFDVLFCCELLWCRAILTCAVLSCRVLFSRIPVDLACPRLEPFVRVHSWCCQSENFFTVKKNLN